MSDIISADVTGRKSLRTAATLRWLMIGFGAELVDCLIFSVFSAKNAANSFAECSVVETFVGGSSKQRSLFHNILLFPEFLSIVNFQ
jgi:hypothetical protein